MLSDASPPCDLGVLRGAPDTPGCASYAKRWVLATTVFGSSIAFVEASVINVALPAIQQGLDASVGEMQWIASIYTLFLAALTLASGSAGDRYGRRRVFSLGLVVLAAASIAAGCATDGRHLIAARAVQGIGSALPRAPERVVPATRARPCDRRLVGRHGAHRLGRPDPRRLARRRPVVAGRLPVHGAARARHPPGRPRPRPRGPHRQPAS
jgi:hypothetical protein